MHKNATKFLQALVAFPVLAMNLAAAPITGSAGLPSAAVISPETNRPLTSEVTLNKQSDFSVKVQKVEAYLVKYNSPLVGHGKEFVTAAEENDLPYASLVAVARQESSLGLHACPNNKANVFGYRSCRGTTFQSVDDAIDAVAIALSGKGATTSSLYKDQDFTTRLKIYNGREVSSYATSVIEYMNQIEQQPIASDSTSTNV